ncbi:MAG: hypothetical protein ACWGMZ_02405, partial [Thermoguttaceae bacterium]
MSLFTRKKEIAVHNFVLKLINNNCSELKALLEGPRRDRRVNLTVVVLVAPLLNGKLQLHETFYTVTKE